MSDYINKTPSELLTLLVDGELHDSDASLLFDSLSKNEELRRELLEHLKIRESIRNDVEAFTPPIEATRGVFEQLGIATFVGSTSTTGFSNGKFMPIFFRFGLPLIAVIIASLITAKVVSDHYESKIAEITSKTTDISAVNSELVPEDKNLESALIAGEFNSKPIKGNTTKYSSSTQNNILTDNLISDNLISENENFRNNLVDVKPILQSENNYSYNKYNTSSIRDNKINQLGFSQIYTDLPVYGNSIIVKNYTLSFAGVVGKNINSQINNFITGFNIGFYPILSNDLKIGFVVGREPFGIELLNSSNNQYENDPKMPVFWAGVSGHYGFSQFRIFDNLTPYSQVTIGANEYGMLTKLSAGLQFGLFPNIETAIGAEYSLLRYKNQLQTLYNNKLSFTANLFFNF